MQLWIWDIKDVVGNFEMSKEFAEGLHTPTTVWVSEEIKSKIAIFQNFGCIGFEEVKSQSRIKIACGESFCVLQISKERLIKFRKQFINGRKCNYNYYIIWSSDSQWKFGWFMRIEALGITFLHKIRVHEKMAWKFMEKLWSSFCV